MTALAIPRRRLGAGYYERATLADATRAVLRPIHPTDAPLLQAGFRQLSDRTRYLRFHGPRGDLSPEELRFLTEVDGESHFALVATLERSQRLAGVARFCRSTGFGDAAEIALVIADDVQGKGLGELLLSRLREAALERDVTRFTGAVLFENRAMRGLLRKIGGRVGLPSRGVCDIDLRLA
jgi:RimJ/RimL family protein N-acetyltransferase